MASTLLALLALGAINRVYPTANQHQSDQIQQLVNQVSALQSQADALKSASEGRDLVATTHASCNCSLPDGPTYASAFGVIGDADADDGPALQAAIDSAASNASGGTVILPAGTFRINSPLIVPGGVTLQGMGYGSSPLAIQFDAGASTIAYCGTDYAVKLTGHAASLRDLAVYDWPYTGCEDVEAAGGVLVEADQTLVESVIVSNVFIYFFLGGPALSLVAKNSAGVAFGNYQNVRIRHAKTGVYLAAEEGSFVNVNSFIGGGMSGGGFESGIYAEGPGSCNDNKFYGIFIEPPDSDIAHVYVEGSKTNVKLLDVRLEATDKSLDRPIVIIDDSSYGNVMNGILGHTHVQANLNRNPGIDLMSQKSVSLDPAPVNMFWNAAFKGFDGAKDLPGWSLVGTNAHIVKVDDSEAIYPDHHVISVDYLNYGGPFKLMADQTLNVPGHDFVTFGIYARSSVPSSISAAMRYTSGSIISSASHSGSGEWEFIGMTALYDKAAPYFYFSITGDVEITASALTFGHTPATPGASLMSSSGARMAGTLTVGVAIGLPPPSATPYYWDLPKNEGNTFLMDMQGDPNRTIIRLNHSTAGRFARGTIVTLMFSLAGTRVKDNAYIELKNNNDFVSVVNSSITLMASGGATWTEVSRNA